MHEIPTPQEPSITVLLAKYPENEDLRLRRERGVDFLRTFGLSQPAVDIVHACYVRENLVWSTNPTAALTMTDLPSTINQAVGHSLEQARLGNVDMRTELTTIKGVLETINTMNNDARSIPLSDIDELIYPLQDMVGYALDYIK